MKPNRYFLLAIFCFSITANALSQTKEITHEGFYQPLRQAYKLESEVSRRIITQNEYYEDGKLSSTTKITEEFLKPGKRRYVEVKTIADRRNKKEYIQIGENYYCKENSKKWKKSNSWCEGGSLSGLSNVIESKYTVEDINLNNQATKLYTNFTTFKITHPPDKNNGKIAYSQYKYWLDDKGLLLRRESKRGLLDSKEIFSLETGSHEYNPKNLKIEAPIK